MRLANYSDMKTRQDLASKDNYRPIFLINIAIEILNKVLLSQIQLYIKMLTYHGQESCIPGMQG